LLDAYLGPLPDRFDYEGTRYTAREFADRKLKLKPENYVQITSFTHKPQGEWMEIEVPDNWLWGRSLNVSLEEMMTCLDKALDAGMCIGWATDVSEKGFAVRKGLALSPDPKWKSEHPNASGFEFECPERSVTPELRQLGYDRWETTDDHGMLITGKAKAADGRVFYLAKNSWGEIENPVRAGHLLASEHFVRYKTISMLLPVEALSKDDRKKAGL
jgi:bleomycin hydrolase